MMGQTPGDATASLTKEIPPGVLTQDVLHVVCAWCWAEQHTQAFPEQATSTICQKHAACLLSQHQRYRRRASEQQ